MIPWHKLKISNFFYFRFKVKTYFPVKLYNLGLKTRKNWEDSLHIYPLTYIKSSLEFLSFPHKLSNLKIQYFNVREINYSRA